MKVYTVEQAATADAADSSNQIKTLLVTFKEDISPSLKKTANERILKLAQSRFADTRIRVTEAKLPEQETNENANQEKPKTNAGGEQNNK